MRPTTLTARAGAILYRKIYTTHTGSTSLLAVYDIETIPGRRDPIRWALRPAASPATTSIPLPARGQRVRATGSGERRRRISPVPPVPIEGNGTLVYWNEALYAQSSGHFVRYDVTTGTWEELPPSHGG